MTGTEVLISVVLLSTTMLALNTSLTMMYLDFKRSEKLETFNDAKQKTEWP